MAGLLVVRLDGGGGGGGCEGSYECEERCMPSVGAMQVRQSLSSMLPSHSVSTFLVVTRTLKLCGDCGYEELYGLNDTQWLFTGLRRVT